ncbi:AUXIN RESPONSE FACTOR 4-RELATED [Salix viminalis]|uniref:AUXIN RESPONSE FACTOR 4-RELATED n=1 Tax=Salix viminalis TaxID=40686 RepID=A0A9Q0SP16_SALVM|nr:AUXIN RESPONSE FACTOR 4-RELATED [Salix viminalis]
MDSSPKFTVSTTMQNMLGGSLCTEGSGNLLDFTRASQSTLTEQLPQQSWVPKYSHQDVNAFSNSLSHPRTYPEKDPSMEAENCNSDAQNPTLFGLLLPTTVPRYPTSTADTDVSSMPLGDSGFQNSLYGCGQDSSELLPNAGQMDPPTPSRTFVKPDTFVLVVPICRLFVNNVWYIKILSPEDILKMGEQGVESSGTNAMQRMSGGMA